MDTVTGYDGTVIAERDRVELHPGSDLWMRGARYGTVECINIATQHVRVMIDRLSGRSRYFHATRLRRI
jgi:hypothetical protein